jgi:hypothetical protein
MAKKIIKLISINLLILALIFIFLELIFVKLFPEFRNHIHTKTIGYGKHMVYEKFGGVETRVPYKGYETRLDNDANIAIVIGDSISFGAGCAYEDIYWRKFERIMSATSSRPLQIINLPGYGNNLQDSAEKLDAFLARLGPEVRVNYVIYQFNFNDIMPYRAKDLKTGAHLPTFQRTDLFKKVNEWRYEYFNRSVLVRVLQHLASRIRLKRYGSCAERGLDALGPYTWTYGSPAFKAESERAWQDFNGSLEKLAQLAGRRGAQCIMVISPILVDIDTAGVHPYYNWQRYAFECATINPRKRLQEMAQPLRIGVIDPQDYVRSHFERRVREGNFEPFYFATDENHITPVAAEYIAEFMARYFKTHGDN